MKLAISTCPNDTFAFHAILNQRIDFRGLELEIELLDIEQLNRGLQAGLFDVAKASFHAALRLTDRTVVLPSGSALGFGVGPLLLAAKENTRPDQFVKKNDEQKSDGSQYRSTVTLCPGEMTTAAMLFRMFYADAIAVQKTRIEHVVFSDIMPALQQQRADFGVCIHEGRFTWKDEGLFLVQDLGSRWEGETGSPLPLGGILASRSLSPHSISAVQSVIRDSIEYGLANRDETLPTMRKYAQELSDDVLLNHVNLYVNDWTISLGETGRQALNTLSQMAEKCGLVEPGSATLEIWSG